MCVDNYELIYRIIETNLREINNQGNLPIPYVSPWLSLKKDLKAVLADVALRIRQVWRISGEKQPFLGFNIIIIISIISFLFLVFSYFPELKKYINKGLSNNQEIIQGVSSSNAPSLPIKKNTSKNNKVSSGATTFEERLSRFSKPDNTISVSYTHLRAHET